MALTLAEAAKLSNDVVLQGVVETVVKESPILDRLPFIELVGNSLKYNRESTQGGAAFYAVGDAWTEGTPTFTQVSTGLTILGGDADVDRYLASTRNNVQDLEAAVIQLKARDVAQAFEQAFVTGDSSLDPKQFDGLNTLLLGARTTSMGVNGASLTLAKLDELVDLVRPGRPDLLLLSKRTRRSLMGLVRGAGSAFLETHRDDLGRYVEYWNGIPLAVSDFVGDAETVGTSTDCSSVYALQLGEGRLAGLQGPGGLQVERVGELETKDAVRWRVKWYVGLALFSELSCARLNGVRP